MTYCNLLASLLLATVSAFGGHAWAQNTIPLSAAKERVLTPSDSFQECTNCPLMKVVPSGSFTMGSPVTEAGRFDDEGPPHKVTIAQQFAIGTYELTFEQWHACVADGGCKAFNPPDKGWGGGTRPVINVSWDDANAYIGWLRKKTGKPYRLLSEFEYEYATRAGTTTTYPWGDDIGKKQSKLRRLRQPVCAFRGIVSTDFTAS